MRQICCYVIGAKNVSCRRTLRDMYANITGYLMPGSTRDNFKLNPWIKFEILNSDKSAVYFLAYSEV